MHKNVTYLILFVVTILLQTFIFNNLTVSVYLNPLVCLAFVALLPLETPPGLLLLAGLMSGIAADWSMAAAGVNTISTVMVAFIRPALLNTLFGKENIRDGGIPSPVRFGAWGFMRYMICFVVLHHILFFFLEALTFNHFVHTLISIVLSSTVTILFTWLAAYILTSNASPRL